MHVTSVAPIIKFLCWLNHITAVLNGSKFHASSSCLGRPPLYSITVFKQDRHQLPSLIIQCPPRALWMSNIDGMNNITQMQYE